MVEALANNAKMPKAMLYSRENLARAKEQGEGSQRIQRLTIRLIRLGRAITLRSI